MTMKLALAAAMGLIAVPVLAADPIMPTPAPYVPPMTTTTSAHDWTGFYVGASVGFARAETDADVDDQSGFGAALHAGYNYDFGDFVAGVRGDFAPAGLANIESGDRELGHAGRIVGNLGYKFGDATMAYALGGVAIAQSSDGGDDYTDYGWTAGLGVAHALDDSLILSGEVTYARFDEVAGTDYDVNALGASIGLSFQF